MKSVAIEIYKGFTQSQLIVPLEIVLYNIINFIPSSTRYSLSVNIFPLNLFCNSHQNFNVDYPSIDNKTIKLERCFQNTFYLESYNENYIEKLYPYPTFDIEIHLLLDEATNKNIHTLIVNLFYYLSESNKDSKSKKKVNKIALEYLLECMSK